MSNLWSPHPRGAYTTMVNGKLAGLGAREEFDNRPGLWNMFWLHSVKVDLLLDWSLPPDQAPAITASFNACLASADYDCLGVSFELMCEKLPARTVINRLIVQGLHPPIRVFWDETESGWLSLVNDRLLTYKSARSVRKERGVVIKGNFPLHSKRQ